MEKVIVVKMVNIVIFVKDSTIQLRTGMQSYCDF
jgi:hypothetical protein